MVLRSHPTVTKCHGHTQVVNTGLPPIRLIPPAAARFVRVVRLRFSGAPIHTPSPSRPTVPSRAIIDDSAFCEPSQARPNAVPRRPKRGTKRKVESRKQKSREGRARALLAIPFSHFCFLLSKFLLCLPFSCRCARAGESPSSIFHLPSPEGCLGVPVPVNP